MKISSDLSEAIAHRRFGPISLGIDLEEARALVGNDKLFNKCLEPVWLDDVVAYKMLIFGNVEFHFERSRSDTFNLIIICIAPQKEANLFKGRGIFTFDSYGLHRDMRLIDMKRMMSRHSWKLRFKHDVSSTTSSYGVTEGVSFIFSRQSEKSVKRLYGIELSALAE